MWASPVEYLRLDLRAHELLRDVPLYDVSVVDLPGGGDGRSVPIEGRSSRSPGSCSIQHIQPVQPPKDADTRAAGNVGPIPSFPGNYRADSHLSPKPLWRGLSR